MAIRDWSGRRLANIWALGVALEAVLIAIPVLEQRLEMARVRREQEQMQRPAASISPAHRDSILRELRDSVGIDITMRGDTISDVTFSPELQGKIDRATPAIRTGFTQLVIAALTALAIVYLPVPLFLLTITVIWIRSRFNSPQGGSLAPP